MSKLGCTCGHIIRDQTDLLPYKAHLLRDHDIWTVLDKIESGCEALITAVVAGDRESWIKQHFLECYPRNISNGSVFYDFVSGLLLEAMDHVYECTACGRLWVQRPGTDNEFTPYAPDSGNVEHVLRSVRNISANEQ